MYKLILHGPLAASNSDKIASLNRLRDEFLQFLEKDVQENCPTFMDLLKKTATAETSLTASILPLEKGISPIAATVHDQFTEFQEQMHMIHTYKQLNEKNALSEQSEKMTKVFTRVEMLNLEIAKLELCRDKMKQSRLVLEKALVATRARKQAIFLKDEKIKELSQLLHTRPIEEISDNQKPNE